MQNDNEMILMLVTKNGFNEKLELPVNMNEKLLNFGNSV